MFLVSTITLQRTLRRPHPILLPRKKLKSQPSDLDGCTMAGSSFQKVMFLSDPKKLPFRVFLDKKTVFFGRPGGCVFPHRSPGVFSTH